MTVDKELINNNNIIIINGKHANFATNICEHNILTRNKKKPRMKKMLVINTLLNIRKILKILKILQIKYVFVVKGCVFDIKFFMSKSCIEQFLDVIKSMKSNDDVLIYKGCQNNIDLNQPLIKLNVTRRKFYCTSIYFCSNFSTTWAWTIWDVHNSIVNVATNLNLVQNVLPQMPYDDSSIFSFLKKKEKVYIYVRLYMFIQTL